MPLHEGPLGRGTQIPGQSAPPVLGSQLSFGSSMQIHCLLGHCFPVKPPHFGGGPGTHTPMQSAPPCFGSQSSLGSSAQISPRPLHGVPAKPPHGVPVGFGGLVVVDANGGSRGTQTPMQSAPPCSGSQSSLGSSTQTSSGPSQGIPAKPPQGAPVGLGSVGREVGAGERFLIKRLGTQMPGQSAPPCFGSQSSFGLSMQTSLAPSHGVPRKPPHAAPGPGFRE